MFTKDMFTKLVVGFMAVFASCSDISTSIYEGYEEVIDVNNIKTIRNNTSKKIIDLHIPPIENAFFDYNEYLRYLRFVKLEKTDQSVIGKIDKLLLADDRIIVVDFKITESVFIFDSTGRFINKIAAEKDTDTSSSGLSHFMDVVYYHNTNEIILHDSRSGQSYYYDNKGNFKRADKEYVSFFNFENLKNTDYFVYLDQYTQNNHIPALTTSDVYLGKESTKIQHIVPGAVQTVKINANYHYPYNLCSGSGSTVFYTPVFSDTIFAIDANGPQVYPKFAFHFPGPDLVSKVKEHPQQIDMEQLNKLRNSDQYFSFMGKILPVKDSIYFMECYKDEQLGYFYSEKSNKIIGGYIRSRMAYGDSARIEFYQYPVASHNQEFVSVIMPENAALKTNTLRTVQFSNAMHGIDRNCNPVLAFYTLKPF